MPSSSSSSVIGLFLLEVDVGDEVAMKRGKSVKSIVPILKHDNVKEKDKKDILSSEANSTPWLHLFFRNNVFKTAHVAGNKHEQAGEMDQVNTFVKIICIGML